MNRKCSAPAPAERGLGTQNGGVYERTGRGFPAVPRDSIVISIEEARTSERNRFPGRASSILRAGEVFDVEVDCSGVSFISSLTGTSIEELGLADGQEVFVSFKAGSVHIF